MSDISNNIDVEIDEVYFQIKELILESAKNNEVETCFDQIMDLWIFMNRFRQCDLKKYYDEDIHKIIKSFNKYTYDTSHLLQPKKEFRIAFLMSGFSNTGGASVPHRFILERYPDSKIKFKQYALVTNLAKRSDLDNYEAFEHLNDNLDLSELHIMKPIKSWLERGKFIQQWIYDRNIDFVITDSDPASLYAISSRPALFHGILSQDCYAFTLGPGMGDLTFLVTTDQVFKYKFEDLNSKNNMKIIMLPLHSKEYIENAKPLSRKELNIPEDAVLSATTNIWKCSIGDSEVLLEGIADLIKKFPNYHHIFAGTPRCLRNVEFFLNKNPEIKNNIHYIGIVENIYSLLKCIDFWVNSFPVSGGSDIESAMLGKPSIEFIANRNLNLHGCEFMRTRECDVTSLDEFIELGSRLISDKDYRDDLGNFLKIKIDREFDKNRILKEKLYGAFLSEFERRLKNIPQMNSINLDKTIEYEKHIGLFNSYGQKNWTMNKKKVFLEHCTSKYPERPFAWVKSIEESIINNDNNWFEILCDSFPEFILKDYRIHIMMALAYEQFDKFESAIKHIYEAVELAIYDNTPKYLLARYLIKQGQQKEAEAVLSKINEDAHRILDVKSLLEKSPASMIPLFYNY